MRPYAIVYDPPPGSTLDDVARAELGRSEQLWIHARALPALGLPDRLPHVGRGELVRNGCGLEWPAGSIDSTQRWPATIAPWSTIRDHGDRLSVVVPAWWRGNALSELEPEVLETTLTLYSRSLGGQLYHWTPGATGIRLLESLHPRSLEGSSTVELPDDLAGAETDLRIWRPLTEAERAREWIVAVDQSGRYLASCASVDLGLGDPVRTDSAWTRPGYYRVRLQWPTMITPANMLPPWSLGDHWRWITLPTLELAQQLDAVLEIGEAWVYPRSSRYLRSWYEQLRDGRAILTSYGERPGAPIALKLLKRTYTETIGGFAGEWRAPGDRFYRPDWRHAIVALSRANTWRAIGKLEGSLGVRAFAVDVDCAYFALDDDHLPIVSMAVQMGEGRLGSWRRAGERRGVPAELVDELDGGSPLGMLRRLVR